MTGKNVMWCGINSNKFTFLSNDTLDPFIAHITNPLKSVLAKKVLMSSLFSNKALTMAIVGP